MPTAPARARSASAPRPTSSRARATSATASSSPRCPIRRRSRPRPARSRTWSSARTIEGIADVNDESAGGKTRLIIELEGHAGARHPQQPVQAHAAADELRRQHGGPGRRRAAHAEPAADAAGLHRAPDGGHPAAQPVPPRQGPQAGPPGRGPAQGHQRHRRGHRPHPGVRRPGRSAHRPHGRTVRVLDRPGRTHPRHAPRAAHPAGPHRPRDRARRAAPADRRPRGDPRRRRPAARGHQGGAARGQGALRRRAPLRDHVRHRRHRHRRPHRRRRAGRHDVERGYIKSVPADTFRSQGRGGRGVAGAKLHDDDYVTQILTTTTARVPAVLLDPGPCLPAQGARDPPQGAHGPRHRHRQPVAAATRRADPGDHRHPRLRDAPLPVLRHPQGAGEEDPVQRVRLVAAQRPHRHQPA